MKFGWSSALQDREYFFRIPRTLSEAEAEGWRRTERPPGPLPELKMYCPPGRAVCPLFDTSGFVAGLQLAVSPCRDQTYPVEAVMIFAFGLDCILFVPGLQEVRTSLYVELQSTKYNLLCVDARGRDAGGTQKCGHKQIICWGSQQNLEMSQIL